MFLSRVFAGSLFVFIGAVSAFSAVVDSLPYDSIANPLSKLPTTVANIQQMGDSMNIVPGRVRINQAGYRLEDVQKGWGRIYYVDSASTPSKFTIIDDKKNVVATGSLVSKGQRVSGRVIPYAYYNAQTPTRISLPGYSNATGMKGSRAVAGTLYQGFLPTDLKGGRYRIAVGKDTSQSFIVSDNVYGMARDAALKFFGVARSGDYQSWFHPASHLWDGWLYDSAAKNTDGSYKYKGKLTGGWYDCGNHLKESRTMSYSLAVLGMLAATMRDRDADKYALNQAYTTKTDGIPDVLREAWVGSQFALNSWRLAKGVTDSMYLSVGNPPGGGTPPGKIGVDFLWWGRPETQDAVTSTNRGGRNERPLVRNWGTPSMADWAAGLAFVSKLYSYDKAFADTALTMAKAMYAQAKKTNGPDGGNDYNGESVVVDDLALAATALFWVTKDKAYLNDLAYTDNMIDGKKGTCGKSKTDYFTSRFSGGYWGCAEENYFVPSSGLAWANINQLSLYSFIKLILVNADTAANYGITSAQRDTLLYKALNRMVGSEMQAGSGKSITLPIVGDRNSSFTPTGVTVGYDTTWFNFAPGSGVSGWYNKYEFGYFADLYMYWDATSIVDGKALLDMPASTAWKRDTVERLIVDGMNYMFGTNAMDLSYIYGIGHKNSNHPHHRAANPEGKNVPGAFYNYRIPVGGLWGGPLYSDSVVKDLWENQVGVSEANCPDASAAVMIPLMGLSKSIPNTAPVVTVMVRNVMDTSALIQVGLDKYGYVRIDYGKDSTVGTMKSTVWSPDSGVTLQIHLGHLEKGTKYYFAVTAFDLHGDSTFTHAWISDTDTVAYSFTTKTNIPSTADYSNIKVCNVTADSAEVMWYTPNGEFLSSILYADSANWVAGKYSEIDTDEVGDVAVKFHRVRITDLKEQTTYYFKVGVPGTYHDEVGCFRTPITDVKFDIRASRYTWPETGTYGTNGVMRAMSIGVTNQDSKSYDSLMLKIYLRGTKFAPDSIVKFGARCDIGFKYRSDGYIDSGFESRVDGPLRRSYATKINPNCPDDSVCDWYFNIPLYDSASSTVMDHLARFRLDLLFDVHKYEYDNNTKKMEVYPDLMNAPPPHDPFAANTKDWSFRTHVAGGDNGLSPIDYAGVPVASKDVMDDSSQNIPINPYIAVYRKNVFIYGFSPNAVEQATKRTVYAMDVTYDAPFNKQDGSTISFSNGPSVTYVSGTADVYDQLLPTVKGYITSIWVNGSKLPAATLASSISRQANGTWKFRIPVHLTTGSNAVNVTIFAGSDSADTGVSGACSEGEGCAFSNGDWLVNNISTRTMSSIELFRGGGAALPADSTVALGSDSLMVQVTDGDRDASGSADVIHALVNIASKGHSWIRNLDLVETGAHTGIFRSTIMPVAFDDGSPLHRLPSNADTLWMKGPDTVLFTYVDSSMDGDTSRIRAFTRSLSPYPDTALIKEPCGGGRTAKVNFDAALTALPDSVVFRWTPPGAVQEDTVLLAAKAYAFVDTAHTSLLVDLSSIIDAKNTSASGTLDLHVPSTSGIYSWVSTPALDGVGPKLLQVQIYENFGTGPDTLRAVFSEKPTFSKAWPFLLKTNAGTFAVDTSWLDSAAIQRYVFIVTPASGSALTAGKDSLGLDPEVVADVRGNDAADAACQSWSRLGLYTRPVPIRSAWIEDSNGDGRADRVHVIFGRALLAREVPDSFVVSFGAGSDTLRSSSSWTTSDSLDFAVNLATPFPATATRGSGVAGAGSLWVSRGGFVDLFASTPLADSVGPNAVSARLRYGDDGDTLILTLTESAAFKGSSNFATKVDGTKLGRSVRISGNVAYIVVDTGTVVPMADSVRVGSGLLDAFGNASGAANPAVLVKGGDRPPVSAWFEDVNGDGTVDSVVLSFPRVLRTMPSFVVRWPNRAGNLVADTVRANASDTGNSAGLVLRFAVHGMDSLVTGYDSSRFPSRSLGSMIDTSTGEEYAFPILDRVAPVLVSATLRYSVEDGALDTLVLLYSEAVDPGIGKVAFLNREGRLIESRSHVMLSDNTVALLLDTAQSLNMSSSDSLAAATLAGGGTLLDLLGNQPSLVGRWVRLKIGPQKSVFVVNVQNPVLVYNGWMDAKQVPGPTMQIFVQGRDSSWQSLSGATSGGTGDFVNQGMGVVIRTNQAFGGFAYVYDNLGTFVAKIDLSEVAKQWGDLPKFGKGYSQIWLRWDGRTSTGAVASSGVYTLRLVTRRDDGTSATDATGHYINQLYKMGWKKKP